MERTATQAPFANWPVDGPLAMESYLTALESEQSYQQTVSGVLAEIRHRLGLPAEGQLLSARQVRTLFARYVESAPPRLKLVSEMVSDMREE